MRAALNPIPLDERQVSAVAGRIELDLRLGAAFTRFQTFALQTLWGPDTSKLISYGMQIFPSRLPISYKGERIVSIPNFGIRGR